ncbi:trans-sialidase [Trypanosoma cruzi]|nr:trans-sialidase [Trypanosoma cruzi]
MCSIFGSRKITARFLLDPLPWIITWNFSSNLLYSGGALHILRDGIIKTSNTISLVPLTEGLQMINYVLKSWAQLDSSFSELFTPTAGLVVFLSNASSDGDTWSDDYLSVNAIVTKNAMKFKDGFVFTGPWAWDSMAREQPGA